MRHILTNVDRLAECILVLIYWRYKRGRLIYSGGVKPAYKTINCYDEVGQRPDYHIVVL